MKIVLFGGSGLLGKELLKIDSNIIAPLSSEVNIRDKKDVENFIENHKPDIVINSAGFIDNRKIEKDPTDAIETNIIGSANVSLACLKNNVRLVYISSDYIYKGDRGNYKEDDEILPFNIYAWSKLGGETSTRSVKNHLIIRTSFGSKNFSYKSAFNDKYASKDYVDVVAPMIYEAAISSLIGILNLGTGRKTLYEHAVAKNEQVKPISVTDTYFSTPIDTSLNLQKWINYKSNNPTCQPHTKCRCCNSSNMTKYLDLGVMPLANNLEFTSKLAKQKDRFPLQIMFCNDCGLSQLSVVINPSVMFSYYTYRSSINGGYVKHCNKMAKDVSETYGLNSDSFVIDIAGNDGALLQEFKKVFNPKVLNVDPATNLTAIAEQNGIKSLAKFWGLKTAEEIVDNHGKANLITATNVFAHVDNIIDFLIAAKRTLSEKGVLMIEFPYLVDFIENKEYDTTYFEHLSYVSVTPIFNLCNKLGLELFNVEKQNIHGGTVRLSISHSNTYAKYESVSLYLKKELEDGYLDIEKYMQWSKDINETIKDFSSKLLDLKLNGYTISGFGASAKGNTLLNSCNINTDIIDYIADETPEKIGKFSPTTGIPIVNKQSIIDNPTDYIVILAWNFQEEIINKLRNIYKGKFIIPVPEFKVID
jgi:dTDP-4-dehydrorhamnose reductase/ubiquinone/menaquinone biosynthesis C-methylase UbiE